MPNLARLAAAAAILVLALGGGYLLLHNNQSQVAGPFPTATPAPTATPQSVTDALEAKWLALGDRVTPIVGGFATGDSMIIRPSGIEINTFKGTVTSPWALRSDGTIALYLSDPQAYLDGVRWGCITADPGSYRIDLSPGSGTLMLTPLHDACATRAAILGGTWSRWPCPNPDSVCAPELSAGAHVTSFQPNRPAAALNSFSYTVPAGWSEYGGGLGRPNDPGTMGIALNLDVATHSQAPGCLDQANPVGYSAATDLADFLVGVPGLVTTTPQPVTIGGLSGVMLDASVAPTWQQTCQQFFDGPERVVFTFADPAPPPGGGVYIRDFLDRDAHARYVLLDVSPGHNLLIEVDAPDQATFSDIARAAMPIIDSFQFTSSVGPALQDSVAPAARETASL